MSEAIRVGIHEIDRGELIAGPVFLNVLPRQGDILRVDGVYHQVKLVEVDYKTQDVAKAYVLTIGDEDMLSGSLRTLCQG